MSAAMQSRDFEAIRELTSPDVVLNSPITSSFRFEGPDEIVDLLRVVRDTYEYLEYTAVFGDGDTWAQVFRVRIRGQEMEGTDVMRLDEEGRIREFTVFFRPLPGLAALTAALAPGLARQRGRGAALPAALTRPLELATRLGDRVAARLVGRGPG
jgi:SnoaL-like domain